MPRHKRELAETGVYHLINRGIDKQDIFYDDIDKKYFVKWLHSYSSEANATLYCYCLMDNHYHLLMWFKEGESPAEFMKMLGVRYVGYFNDKYDRTGSLFEGRYKSECITDRKYFLNVFRYICQNPIKAGMVEKAEDYRFSTAYEIKRGYGISQLNAVYGELPKKNIIEFINEKNEFSCMHSWKNGISDDECLEMYKGLCEKYGFDRAKKRNVLEFDNDFKEMFKPCCSISQISRVTGLSRKTVQKILS
jgi:REP element-mobilizing transposase RayT